MAQADQLIFSFDEMSLSNCDVYIVTVPTPIDSAHIPDLRFLISASRLLGKLIERSNIVVYESTVYPGCTEQQCIPLIESGSGLKYNKDFYAGYSPERINPGDKLHRVTDIVKVTSGCNPEIAEYVDQLYSSVIIAGTHKAESIRVAEAAKVIENTQRDLNIALVNELAQLFEILNIDTNHVLKAAGTKWNFLGFQPGLVGGHCISVDPYYLAYKAQQVGFHPEVILSARKVNDEMGQYVVESVVKLMLKKRIHVLDAKVLIMGVSFKENCPDIRNTRVVDVIQALSPYHVHIDLWDPWVNKEELESLSFDFTNVDVTERPEKDTYDVIILCVAHDQFKEMSIDEVRAFGRSASVVYDVKAIFNADDVDARL